jgi:hypothetical protein
MKMEGRFLPEVFGSISLFTTTKMALGVSFLRDK